LATQKGEDQMHKIARGFIGMYAAVVLSTGAVFAQQAPTPPPAPPFGTPITLGQAEAAIKAAIAEAKRINVNEAIAVVEPTGDLVNFSKMDGASYSAIALSQAKAVTAARYRRPTKFFNEQVESGHHFFLSFPQMVASAGGVLIVVDGKTVGAIAASGGNGEQDAQVAAAGAAAVKSASER
jgi:glc operon protein GlcG